MKAAIAVLRARDDFASIRTELVPHLVRRQHRKWVPFMGPGRLCIRPRLAVYYLYLYTYVYILAVVLSALHINIIVFV